MQIQFQKMSGAGNDFVVIDNRDLQTSLSKEQIAALCDRHFGIGADGLLAVEPPQTSGGEADYRMRYYNADGGEAEMCGNGARCFARFARDLENSPAESVSFETMAGVITATFPSTREVTVNLSEPQGLELNAKLTALDKEIIVHSLNTGVPHALHYVDDVAAIEQGDFNSLGAALRYHEHFAPNGTNANLLHLDQNNEIHMRTYERGVEGETLACGTGIAAAALVSHLLHDLSSPVAVYVKGGDRLEVGFHAEGEQFSEVTLTGPADYIFDGEITLP